MSLIELVFFGQLAARIIPNCPLECHRPCLFVSGVRFSQDVSVQRGAIDSMAAFRFRVAKANVSKPDIYRLGTGFSSDSDTTRIVLSEWVAILKKSWSGATAGVASTEVFA